MELSFDSGRRPISADNIGEPIYRSGSIENVLCHLNGQIVGSYLFCVSTGMFCLTHWGDLTLIVQQGSLLW